MDKIILGMSIPLGIIAFFFILLVIMPPYLPERIPQHGVSAPVCNDVYCADNYIRQCKPSYITLTFDDATSVKKSLFIQVFGKTGEGVQNLPENACWVDVQSNPQTGKSENLPYYQCMIPLDRLDDWNSWSIDSDTSVIDNSKHIKEIQQYCTTVDNAR